MPGAVPGLVGMLLWMTDKRKVASFYALDLCQMIFYVGEVEGGFHSSTCAGLASKGQLG